MRATRTMTPLLMALTVSFLLTEAGGALQGLGGACMYDDECDMTTTFCRDRRSCACKENFREESGACIATVGARCLVASDCNTLQYSTCEENICTCREGYVIESSRYRCLPVVTMFGGVCQENLQCQKGIGERSYCRNYECQCDEGYHYADWHCQKSRGLGEECSASHNCSYVGLTQNQRNRVTCEKNRCRCSPGFHEDETVCVDNATALGASLGLIFIFWIVRFSLKVLD